MTRPASPRPVSRRRVPTATPAGEVGSRRSAHLTRRSAGPSTTNGPRQRSCRAPEGHADREQLRGDLIGGTSRVARPSELAQRLGGDLEVVIEGLAAQGAGAPAPRRTGSERRRVGRSTPVQQRAGAARGRVRPDRAPSNPAPLIAALPDRERRILLLRFDGRTQAEIGERWESPRCRVTPADANARCVASARRRPRRGDHGLDDERSVPRTVSTSTRSSPVIAFMRLPSCRAHARLQ